MTSESPVSILQAAKQGKLRQYLNQYVELCYSQSIPGATNRRPSRRFPNFAGFCYFMGCGMTELTRLQSEYPEEANYIETVMEDEALNSPFMPASVLLLYLKARLDYGTKNESRSQKPKQPMQIQCIYEPPEAKESPEVHTEQTEQPEPEEVTPILKATQTPPQLHSPHLRAKRNQTNPSPFKPPSRYFLLPRPPPGEKMCSLTISYNNNIGMRQPFFLRKYKDSPSPAASEKLQTYPQCTANS